MPTSQCGRQSSWLTNSADHLVRLEEERGRDREAEGLRSPEVEDQLELHGLFYREVGWFHPLGNNNQFHELSPNSKLSGFPWREHAIVRPDAPFHTGTTPPPAMPGSRTLHSSGTHHTHNETHRMTSPPALTLTARVRLW